MKFNLENKKIQKNLFNLFENLALTMPTIFNMTKIEFEINFEHKSFTVGLITNHQGKIKGIRKENPFETLQLDIKIIKERLIDFFKHYMPYTIKEPITKRSTCEVSHD